MSRALRPQRIPCAVADCAEPARPDTCRIVRTPSMPAPAFYYYCGEHAARAAETWTRVSCEMPAPGAVPIPRGELRHYRLKPEEHVYIRSMGRALRVVAICPDVETANALMQVDRTLAVVASFASDTRVYLADQYDRGIVIPREADA